jgi:hypothetical protein
MQPCLHCHRLGALLYYAVCQYCHWLAAGAEHCIRVVHESLVPTVGTSKAYPVVSMQKTGTSLQLLQGYGAACCIFKNIVTAKNCN